MKKPKPLTDKNLTYATLKIEVEIRMPRPPTIQLAQDIEQWSQLYMRTNVEAALRWLETQAHSFGLPDAITFDVDTSHSYLE